MSILLVEKSPSSATSHIGDEYGIVVCAEDADEAMSLLRHDSFDLVLIGMASQLQDGFNLIRRLRASGNETPVVALTGPAGGDKIEALAIGADEAFADPVDPEELAARMTAILGRPRGIGRPVLRLGDLHLSLDTREACFRDMPLNLTPNEFAMLELLVLRKGSVLTKAAIMHHLYSGALAPDSRIIDVFICKLRRKLERAGAGRLISVVWAHGYMISELDALRQRISDIATIERPGVVA